VKNCFDAGMDEFVAKPFTSDELLLKMSKLMKEASA
jgi:CheY-like chemotaxis protein